MTEYFQQNGQGATGSLAGSYFKSQGMDVSMTSVNPVASGNNNMSPPVNTLNAKPA